MKILAVLQIVNFITGHALKHPYVALFFLEGNELK